MPVRKCSVLFVLSVLILCMPGFRIPVEMNGRGKWKNLFDGSTTMGWHLYWKNTAGKCWQVENKSLHRVPSVENTAKGDLVTDSSFENFDLRMEWKIAPGCNSGVIFFIKEDTTG